jgi:hypothetical protein
MTLGDAKGATMLCKGPWVLDIVLGSTINTRKKSEDYCWNDIKWWKRSHNAKQRTLGAG